MNEEVEIWKDVQGYEGLYQVSSFGRVKRTERFYTQLNALTGNYNTKKLSEMIMKPFEDEDGYLRIQLIKEGQRKKHFIHRLVSLNFISNPENKPEVNHKEGDKKDNRVWMLEWSTSSENQRHAIANNLYECQKGETNGHAKLTEVKVREIHELWKLGEYTQEYLGNKYGVAANAISRIVNGIRWKHIYEEIYGD